MSYVAVVLVVLLMAVLVRACVAIAPGDEGSTDGPGVARDPGELLPVGAEAPPFTARDEAGGEVRLAGFAGNNGIVLIFYPGNETPGCTKQLCAARDAWQEFQDSGVQVFGVNPASAESHVAFRGHHHFPFPLISDVDGSVTRAYGARGPFGIVKRTVYGIGKDGKIVFARRGAPRTEEILEAFRQKS